MILKLSISKLPVLNDASKMKTVVKINRYENKVSKNLTISLKR
jgi:hypothetical protein